MGADRDRHSRPTEPLDPVELAKLADAAGFAPPIRPEDEVSFDDLEEKPAEPEAPPPRAVMSRAATLHDPLTTSLLAEVARRSQTSEFDTDEIAERGAEIEKRVSANIKRRG